MAGQQLKRNVMDMTRGNIMPLLIRFSLPIFLGSVFQEIYTLSDTMIAGYLLDGNALAAIGSNAIIYSLMLGFATGMSAGCGVVVARHFGSGDRVKLKQSGMVMLIIGLLLGMAFSAAGILLTDSMIRIMNTPAELYQEAKAYLQVIAGGILITLLYNMCAGYMRALGNSVMPLVFLIIACMLNIVLDLVFILIFHMGIEAEAWATVLAQGFSTVLCFIYLRLRMKAYLPDRETPLPNRFLVQDMLGTGFSMGLMHSVVNIGSVIMQTAVNGLGTAVITAFTGIRRLLQLLSQPHIAIGTAGATFVSQNKGAGEYKRIRKGIQITLLTVGVICFAMSILCLIWGAALTRLLIGSDSAEVMQTLRVACIANGTLLVPLGILVSLRQMMQSLGMKVLPVFCSAIELIMKVCFAMWIVPAIGMVGACWAEPSTWLICVIFIIVAYLARRRQIYPDLQ